MWLGVGPIQMIKWGQFRDLPSFWCKMGGGISNSSARRISVIDHCLRPAHVFALAKVLILSKSNLALPYMDLFNVFRRLM